MAITRTRRTTPSKLEGRGGPSSVTNQKATSGALSYNPLDIANAIDKAAKAQNVQSGQVNPTVYQPNNKAPITFSNTGTSNYGQDLGVVTKDQTPYPGNVALGSNGLPAPKEDYTPQGVNLDQNLPPEEAKQVRYYQWLWNNTEDPEMKVWAHDMAEQIRIRNGYTGGLDGSDYNAIESSGITAADGSPESVSVTGTPTKKDAYLNYTPDNPDLMDIETLSKNYLGDITFDENTILDKFRTATQDEYATKEEKLRGTESAFSRNLYTTGLQAQDAVRKANASAVATGASRGVQAAQSLSALLGLEDYGTQTATELAQQRAALGLEEAEALSQDVVDAMQASNELKTMLGGLSRDKYLADTQFDVGEMDYYASLENSIKGLEGVLSQATMEKVIAEINKDTQKYTADTSYKSYTDTEKIRAASDIAVEKIRADTTLSAADKQAATQAEYNKIYKNYTEGQLDNEANRIAQSVETGSLDGKEEASFLAILDEYVTRGDATAKGAYMSLLSPTVGAELAEQLWNEAINGKGIDSILPEPNEDTGKVGVVESLKNVYLYRDYILNAFKEKGVDTKTAIVDYAKEQLAGAIVAGSDVSDKTLNYFRDNKDVILGATGSKSGDYKQAIIGLLSDKMKADITNVNEKVQEFIDQLFPKEGD